jgi:hypothetical protein
MKQSQLRKLIRESIQQLMNEQQGYGPNGTMFRVLIESCHGTTSSTNTSWGNSSLCVELNTTNPQIGDFFKVTDNSNMAGIYQNWAIVFPVGSVVKIKEFISGMCPNTAPMQPGFPDLTPTNRCPTDTSTGTCNPNVWPNHSNFAATFPYTVTNQPNPCNFLNNKMATWAANLTTAGPNQQNQLQCKINIADQLLIQNNC